MTRRTIVATTRPVSVGPAFLDYKALPYNMDQIPPGTDLTKTPAGDAPMGVESNLIDPPSLAMPTIVVTTVMIILASIFVTIRLSSIFFSGRRTAWDDCETYY